jgi:hypothetical protein
MTGEEKTSGAGSAEVSPDFTRRAEQLIYDYQRSRLEATYSDFAHYDDLHEFFFGLLYPPPDKRQRFAARNRAYTRIASSRLLRIIVAPITIRVMNQVTELEQLTETMNHKLARALCERGPLPDSLEESVYFDLCARLTAIDQHEKMFDFAYEGFYFGELVIKTVKMNLEDMLRLIPRAIIRNSELIDLATQTYLVFRHHRNELETFRLALHERELAYISRMFGVTLYKVPLVYPGVVEE